MPLNILGGLIFTGAVCIGIYYGAKQIFSPSEIDIEKQIDDSIKLEIEKSKRSDKKLNY